MAKEKENDIVVHFEVQERTDGPGLQTRTAQKIFRQLREDLRKERDLLIEDSEENAAENK
jgi:hypothetical protein